MTRYFTFRKKPCLRELCLIGNGVTGRGGVVEFKLCVLARVLFINKSLGTI